MQPILLLVVLLLPAAALSAQNGPDAAIRRDFQAVMDLAAPPSGSAELSEEEARSRAEKFKAALGELVLRWEPRAAELGEGRFVLGKALAMAGAPDRAIPQLRSFIAAHPTSPDIEDGHVHLGTALLDSGQLAAAVEQLEAFTARWPESERRHVAEFYAAIAHDRLGHAEAAIALLQRVAALETSSPLVADANIKLVEALRAAGRIDEAKAHVERLLAENSDAPFLLSLKEQLEWIGREAPELVKIDAWVNGAPATLAGLRGRVVVMNFFADRYEACQVELEALGALARELEGKDVSFLGITKYYRSLETLSREEQQEMMASFLKERRAGFPVAIAADFDNLRSYDVRGVPHTVVVGRDGKVVHVKYGAGRNDPRGFDLLKAAIVRALGG